MVPAALLGDVAARLAGAAAEAGVVLKVTPNDESPDLLVDPDRLEGVPQRAHTVDPGDVAAPAGEEFSFHSLGEHPLRGKRKSVQIFEVV